jgi:hypothetical protein
MRILSTFSSNDGEFTRRTGCQRFQGRTAIVVISIHLFITENPLTATVVGILQLHVRLLNDHDTDGRREQHNHTDTDGTMDAHPPHRIQQLIPWIAR